MKKTLWNACGAALLILWMTTWVAQAQSDPNAADVSAEAEAPQELHLFEDNTATQFIDLRGNGEGPGDMYLWNRNPLIDVDSGEEVGSSSGFCLNTEVTPEVYASECSLTLTLADGSLYVAGTSYNDGDLPIIGGTGIYAGATGILRERYSERNEMYEYLIVIGGEPEIEAADMELIEDKRGTRVVDMGDPGNSVGDLYLWNQNPLTDANSNEEVGSSSGYCIVTDLTDGKLTYQCAWTLTLAEGTFFVAGISYDEGDLPILGGTGAYTGASGLLSEFYDPDRNEFVYEIRLDASPAEATMAADETATNAETETSETANAEATTEAANEEPNAESPAAEADESVAPRQPVGDVEAFWNVLDWADLNAAEQELWAVLGWNQANWDGEADEPASEARPWNELTDREQAAAQQLGYDQEIWDATLPE